MKVGVIIIARNESKHLDATLAAVIRNKPAQIILVDDRSKDNTRYIAREYGCDVVRFPYNHDSWVIHKNLSKVFNIGFERLRDDLDYVCILGADHIITPDYFSMVAKRMKDNIVIASGVIGGENFVNPRGSGRMIRCDFFKLIGKKYPVNYGYETWILFKARTMGYDFTHYDDIVTFTQRKTATNYKTLRFIHKGRAYRALGYHLHIAVIAAMRYITKNPIAAVLTIIGYCMKTDHYEPEIRQYLRQYQAKRAKKILRTLRIYNDGSDNS